MRQKIWILFFAVSFFLFLFSAGVVLAQDASTGTVLATGTNAVQQQKDEIKENAQAAKQEEASIKQQIDQAIKSGDKATAESLRAQLKQVHEANLQEKMEDRQDLKEARQEMGNPPGYNPPGQGAGNPPGYNPPGAGPNNPPGYNPPGQGAGNPPGYNPPGAGPDNPPGYNPPGRGAGNPPGYNPPGQGAGNPPGYDPPGKGPGPKAGAGKKNRL